MTTNGSMLTPDVAPFLVEHGFLLLVSIDGPQWIHDRHRRFANGQASYDTIMTNLGSLAQLAPEYYRSNVSFSSVIVDPLDLGSIREFFATHHLLRDHTILASNVRTYDTQIPFYQLDSTRMAQFRALTLDMMEQHCHYVLEGHTRDRLAQGILDKPLRLVRDRAYGVQPFMFPPGVCLPGVRKLFVETSGTLRPCEKAGQAFRIGDVSQGIDIESVAGLVDSFCELCFHDCPQCWAYRLCPLCYVSARKGTGMSLERKRQWCDRTKLTLHDALVMYAAMLEVSLDAVVDYFG